MRRPAGSACAPPIDRGTATVPADPPSAARSRCGFREILCPRRSGALIRILDPDVVWRSDGGGRVMASRRILHGAPRVARALLALGRRPPQHARVADVNGAPGLVVLDSDGVLTVIALIGRPRRPSEELPEMVCVTSNMLDPGTGVRKEDRTEKETQALVGFDFARPEARPQARCSCHIGHEARLTPSAGGQVVARKVSQRHTVWGPESSLSWTWRTARALLGRTSRHRRCCRLVRAFPALLTVSPHRCRLHPDRSRHRQRGSVTRIDERPQGPDSSSPQP